MTAAPIGIIPLDAEYLAGLGLTADQVLTFGEVLALLGIGANEHVGFLFTRQQVSRADKKRTTVQTAADAASFVAEHLDRMLTDAWNAYFGINTTTLPVRDNCGRGTEKQIEAVHGCYADLDVKLGACPDLNVARMIADWAAQAIRLDPTVLIYSGGGLQPIWALAEGVTPEVGIPLIRRVGRLIRTVAAEVAEELGLPTIGIDPVFDGARVLRLPGSHNHKYAPARPVVAVAGSGARIDADLLSAALDAANVAPEEKPQRAVIETPAAAGKNPIYVAKALSNLYAEMGAAVPHGTDKSGVNDTLARVSRRVFELAKGGHVDYRSARAELERITLQFCEQHECRKWIDSTLDYAWQHVEARDIPAPRRPAYTLDPKEFLFS